MTAITESPHAGGFILSEANGQRSRENITILSGEDLEAGAVLGKVTASGKYVAYDPAGSDGSETAAGVLLDAVDASDGDADGVGILRDAEVNENELVYEDAVDTSGINDAVTDLKALGILVR